MPPLLLALSSVLTLVLSAPCARAETIALTLRGEVARPELYRVLPGSRLSALIDAAGGVNDNAWLPGAVLTRRTTLESQGKELSAIADRLEQAEASAGPDPEGARFSVAVRSISPSGRIPVRLSHPRLLRNSPDDLPLEDGDVLQVPSLPAWVRVEGAVSRPGLHPFREGAGVAEYLEDGGILPDGNARDAFVLRADGSAAKVFAGPVEWNEKAGRWELTWFTREPVPALPGDTVAVPRKLPRSDPLSRFPDLDRILMRVAEIAGRPVLP